MTQPEEALTRACDVSPAGPKGVNESRWGWSDKDPIQKRALTRVQFCQQSGAGRELFANTSRSRDLVTKYGAVVPLFAVLPNWASRPKTTMALFRDSPFNADLLLIGVSDARRRRGVCHNGRRRDLFEAEPVQCMFVSPIRKSDGGE